MSADLGNVSVAENADHHCVDSGCHLHLSANSDVVIAGIAHSDCAVADLQYSLMSASSYFANSDVATAELWYLLMSANSWTAIADCVNSDVAMFDSLHSKLCLHQHSWPAPVSAYVVVTQPL